MDGPVPKRAWVIAQRIVTQLLVLVILLTGQPAEADLWRALWPVACSPSKAR